MLPWYLQNSKNWVFFFICCKKLTMEKKLLRSTSTHKNSSTHSMMLICIHSHPISTNPSPPLHMRLRLGLVETGKENWTNQTWFVSKEWAWIQMSSSGGGGRPEQIYIFLQFFSTCEKMTQFLEFCKYQGGKIQVKPFVFLLQT